VDCPLTADIKQKTSASNMHARGEAHVRSRR
jgi:hypothetical protein